MKRYYFVGLTATGNRTASRAMRALGYNVKHYPQSIEECDRYQVLTDTPVGMWFRQGKLVDPCSIYVLTVRDNLNEWLNACEAWFTEASVCQVNLFTQELRWFLYDSLVFDRAKFMDAYFNHIELCESVARENGLTLHKWDVTADPHWDFLLYLTGKSAPAEPFPFKHRPPLTWAEGSGLAARV